MFRNFFAIIFFLVDYISLYQIEREKLAQRYRIKDEYIEKLNKKLEMNRVHLDEFNIFLKDRFYEKSKYAIISMSLSYMHVDE